MDDDLGEAAKFERRFAKTVLGHAFLADDGQVRPLSEAEAAETRAEGLRLIRSGARVLHAGSWIVVAGVVAFFTLTGGRGTGLFSGAAIVGTWATIAHLGTVLWFYARVRQAVRIPSRKYANRIALSPTTVAPLARPNWFRVLRGAATWGTIAYLFWTLYGITGSLDPHSLGDGTFSIDGHTGKMTTTGTGNPVDEMDAFGRHLPVLMTMIAICYALYAAEWLTDRFRGKARVLGDPRA